MPELSTNDWDDDIPQLKAPSRWLRGYLLGVLLLIGGLLLGPVMIFFTSARFFSAPADAVVIAAPGESKVDVRETGRMTVWHEQRGFVHGTYSGEGKPLAPGDLKLQVFDPTGQEAPVLKTLSTQVELGFISRSSVSDFDAKSPGVYRVVAAMPPGKTATLTVTRAAGAQIAWMMFVSIAFTLVGMGAALAGVVVIVVTLVRQISAGFLLRQEAP